jgi:hypothetical protein
MVRACVRACLPLCVSWACSKSVEFAYKCHRLDAKDSPDKVAQIYAVNAISFHSRYGTFATAGSDGSYAFWDKDKRQRLKPPAKLCAVYRCCPDFPSLAAGP